MKHRQLTQRPLNNGECAIENKDRILTYDNNNIEKGSILVGVFIIESKRYGHRWLCSSDIHLVKKRIGPVIQVKKNIIF